MIPITVPMQLAVNSEVVPAVVAANSEAVKIAVAVNSKSVQIAVAENCEAVPVTVSVNSADLVMAVSMKYVAGQYADYEGGYYFTPGDKEVVIETKDMHLARNIVIAPVPDSYGRITYNGSAITVY